MEGIPDSHNSFHCRINDLAIRTRMERQVLLQQNSTAQVIPKLLINVLKRVQLLEESHFRITRYFIATVSALRDGP